MRTVFLIIAAAFVAGCANAPVNNVAKVYDHKYNATTYAAKQTQSDFVGTSAVQSEKAKPAWYARQHP